MYWKLIRNDMKKSKLITVTITGFIMMAALFTSLAGSLLVNMLGAIDNLVLDTAAPHYVQMHTGEIDLARLEQFAADCQDVEELQISEFLNIEGADIVIGGQSLADSIQDNGVAVQNKRFDFLLDLNNRVINPQDGEIYVPIYYMTEGVAKLGDRVVIQGMSFTVTGFLRDALMNPSMSSSKRFLVSEHDYEQLRGGGVLEHLIGFRLCEDADIIKFEAAYLGAGLEANGPAGITTILIRLMNGITDGIMIALLLLVSFLILIISFLCVRFTLISKVEEEYKEIGVLKAIGLRVSEIKKLYIAKYSAIAAIGCGLGYLLSLVLQEPMLANIRLYMGRSGKEMTGIMVGGCGAVLVFAVVIFYVNGVLRRFRRLSASQAIRYGAPVDRAKTSKGMSLADNRMFTSTVFLGIKDVIARKGLYLVMFFVLVISCFIMIVPHNINNTIADRSFMSYLGIGECDMGIYVQLVDQIPQKTTDMGMMLAADEEVEQYSILICRMFDLVMDDGSTGKIRVESGDHSAFPLTYARGREPRTEDEISLSVLNGEELQKGIGDTVTLLVGGVEKELLVCGLYSDVTSGGISAKACFQAEGEKVLWGKISIKLKDQADINTKIAVYKEQFSYAKVSNSDDYMEQSLGTTKNVIQTASYIAMAVAGLLTILITLLFMKMLVTKDRYQISVLKSLGFTGKAIRQQYMVRSGIIFLLGAGIGTIAANTLGESVGVALMSSLGVATFHFKINWLFAGLVAPVMIGGCVYIATRLGISDIKSIKISEYIKE